MNKTRAVLEHLQKKGSITSWEAITEYRATRLSAIIFNLKNHYQIDTILLENADGNGRYAKYVYRGVKEDE